MAIVVVLCAAAVCSAVTGGNELVMWAVLTFAMGMAISQEARRPKRGEQ